MAALPWASSPLAFQQGGQLAPSLQKMLVPHSSGMATGHQAGDKRQSFPCCSPPRNLLVTLGSQLREGVVSHSLD